MRFEFAPVARIIFGPGTVTQIGTLARELGGAPSLAPALLPRKASGSWSRC